MKNNIAHDSKHLKIIHAVLETYNAATVQYEEVSDITAVDLMLDLLQYCKPRDWDPGMIFIEALEYYHAEKYDKLRRQNHS